MPDTNDIKHNDITKPNDAEVEVGNIHMEEMHPYQPPTKPLEAETETTKMELSPEMVTMIEIHVQKFLRKTYPELHQGVNVYDFMNSYEMKLFRALLIVGVFGYMVDFFFGPINIIFMIAVYLISGILYSFIKRRKSSILLYWIMGKGTWFAKVLFVLMTGLVVYITYLSAERYLFFADKIQAVIDTIMANIETLQSITERTAAIKDGIVDTAKGVGDAVTNFFTGE